MWQYMLIGIVTMPICYMLTKNYIDRKCGQFSNYMIMNALEKITKVSNENKANFNLNKGGKTATIQYTRLDNTYKLTIPYNRRNGIKDKKYRVYVRYEDDTEMVEITQQPGVPYFVNGSMLGASQVIIENIDTSEKTDYGLESIISL